MKGTALIFGISLLLCTATQAGWRWDKEAYEGAKSGVEQRITSPSYCYDAGFEFSGFVTGFWPDDPRLQDAVGGGVSLAYFFGHNFGLEGSYTITGSGTAAGSDIQVGTFNAVYRFPLGGECCSTIAPYVFRGPGVLAAGSNEMLWNVGGGIDLRFESWGCVGLFGDFSYNWCDQNLPDFTLVRAGFRVPF